MIASARHRNAEPSLSKRRALGNELNPKERFSQATNELLKIPKNDALKAVNPMVATEEFGDILYSERNYNN